jgi:hypothetical protein
MNTIFYEIQPGINRLAFTVSNKTVKQLKDSSIIPATSKTVVYKESDPFLETFEGKAIRAHVDKTKFDNPDAPKKVIVDLELMSMFFLEIFKEIRIDALNKLDSLQMRAMVRSKHDVVTEIEADKQVLRDLPKTIDFSNVKDTNDIIGKMPKSLMVDYDAKYGFKLK